MLKLGLGPGPCGTALGVGPCAGLPGRATRPRDDTCIGPPMAPWDYWRARVRSPAPRRPSRRRRRPACGSIPPRRRAGRGGPLSDFRLDPRRSRRLARGPECARGAPPRQEAGAGLASASECGRDGAPEKQIAPAANHFGWARGAAGTRLGPPHPLLAATVERSL